MVTIYAYFPTESQSTERVCEGKLDSVAPSQAAESPPRLAFAHGRLGWEIYQILIIKYFKLFL